MSARYVVIPGEDALDETGARSPADWQVWCDVEKTRYGFAGDWIDTFSTEFEAQAMADALNAAEAKTA